MSRWLRSCVLAAVGFLLPALAAGDDFPSRPITLICGFPPGAAADALLRSLAESLAKVSGQPVIVENRPGAAGAIAAGAAARAAPDGYTLAQVTNAALRQPLMVPTSLDPIRDLTYVIGISTFEFGLIVDARAPWRNFAEFIEFARTHPGLISYGTIGVASVPHQVMHRLGQTFGIEWTHVPYKGSAEAQLALRAGSLQAISDGVGLMPAVDAGNARVLAVYGSKRPRRYPGAPTLRELGLDIAADVPWGIAASSAVPAQRVRKLHDLLREAMQSTGFLRSLEQYGADESYLATQDYQRYMAARIHIERRIVDEFKLTP